MSRGSLRHDELDGAMATEVARLRAERDEARAALARAAEELQAFAHTTSHDLQAPLRTAQIYAQVLARRHGDALDEDGRACLGHIEVACRRAQLLLRGLLAYSRVESRARPPQPVDVVEVAGEVLRALPAQLVANADVRIAPLPRVLADPDHVRTLLHELLDNALRHGGDAPARVMVLQGGPTDDGRVTLEVQDAGLGFPAEHVERAFALFTRLAPDDETPRAGVGLALCRRIVTRYGGTIAASSVPGGGVTVRFTLPCAAGT